MKPSAKLILLVTVSLFLTVGLLLALSFSAQADTITVTNYNDNGEGSLRQCLLDAEAGDIITFDPNVFPATITLTSDRLPDIDQGNITIDGSGAGVIIDGSQLTSVYDDGFRITSNNNTIMGITIQNFPGDGVDIRDGAQGNKIENCVIRVNGRGGTGRRGVRVDGNGTTGNIITRNSITDNDGPGIVTTNGGNAELAPPIINSVVTSTNAITVTGFALPGVTVEFFRDPGGEGATFLGDTTTDSYGNFTFTGTLTTPLADDNVTATATDASDNTSMFNCYPIPIPNLVWPISATTTPDGPFSSPFGPRFKASDYRYDWHRGLDIYTSIGTTAYAVADGKVRCVGYKSCSYSDRIVQIEHEDGCYYCNYLHMTTTSVITGQTVTQGEVVGTTGASASGFPHLHFEIRRGGYYQRNAINPFVYLPHTDTLSHTAIISGVYVHTASGTPTVTARVVVTAPANELDFNRLALTVTDGTRELDWRVADFHVFNIQKSTIEHPELLDNPYVDDICIMPASFNKDDNEYRIDFVFYGLQRSDPITLTAEATDVHSNVVSTTMPYTAGGLSISPNYSESWVSPGMTGTYTHTLTNNTISDTYTLTLSIDSAQSKRRWWEVQVIPSSTITLDPRISATITATVAVSETVPVGTVDCIVVTATSEDGTQAIAVHVITASRIYLPIVMKNYST